MSDDPEAPPDRAKKGRRSVLFAAGGVLLGAAGAGAYVYRKKSVAQSVESGASLAQQAYAALRDGDVSRGLDLAKRARAADPEGLLPQQAWLHATGLDLLEGNAGASAAVGLVAEARRLGFRKTELAFATLAAAVAIKNDRFARRLLDQHEEQGVGDDAYYDYAAGAALDLDCDPEGAAERYLTSAGRWADALLPRLRRARSLALVERFEDAREEIGDLPSFGREAAALSQIVERLADLEGSPAIVDPAVVPDLPRSIRPLAQAMLLTKDSPEFGIDAALGDIDTPLVATACAKIALAAGDLSSAERALDAARTMRAELGLAAQMLVKVKLLRGDLLNARLVADSASDYALSSLVGAISAYEERKLDILEHSVEDAHASGVTGWLLADAAEGLLGKGKPPAEDLLVEAMANQVPWADILLVDRALDTSAFGVADSVIATWTDPSPPRARRRARLAERRGSP